ncbi:MAG: hypothetical protein RLZZ420_1700 [Bacteroidota bacterium]|jgi:hypothetical protein
MDISFEQESFRSSELPAAQRLYDLFLEFFSGNPCEGKLLIKSYMLPAGYPERDIDILVLLEIAEGSSIKVGLTNGEIALVGGYIFNIEVKEHSSFHWKPEGIFVQYPNNTKNVTRQVWDVKNHLMNYLKGQALSPIPLVADVIFLNKCSRETSLSVFGNEEDIPLNFMDYDITIPSLLQNVTGRNGELLRFNNDGNAARLAAVWDFLVGVKSLPKSLNNKFELFAIESFKAKIVNMNVNQNNVVVVSGAPGSGKTILMLGKAMEIAREGKSCLYLTYNRQLVLDLERLQLLVKKFAPENPFLRLKIETWDSLVARLYSFHNYYVPLGHQKPSMEEKASAIVGRYKSEKGKIVFANDEKQNHKNIFKYSELVYVFVDEAQDLPSGVFEILKTLYGNNICLALGRFQEYGSALNPGPAHEINMDKILRQREVLSKVVAHYLNVAGVNELYQITIPIPTALIGGECIVYTGKIDDVFYGDVLNRLQTNDWNNYDFLHLHINAGDVNANTQFSHYSGGPQDSNPNFDAGKFRYFHYSSCRGLEANIILYEKIDSYYEWCVQNFGETNAKKRIFIALTRAKDIAICTFNDLNHWLYKDVIAQFAGVTNSLK